MLSFCMVVHTEPQSDATHSRRTVSPSARDLCGLSVSALDCSHSVSYGRLDLSPLKCALADKRRVLPVFSRNRQHSSPLEATLMSILVGVDSKRSIVKPKSFRCNIYKKHGGRRYLQAKSSFPQFAMLPPVSPLQGTTFGATIPKGTQFLHDPGNNSAPPGV